MKNDIKLVPVSDRDAMVQSFQLNQPAMGQSP